VNDLTPIIASGSRVRIPSAMVQLGMFVSDLDRPWSDSPFLIEGLLIEQDTELALVQSICREVTIDLSRSWAVEFQGIQRTEPRAEEKARASKEAELDRLARQGRLMQEQARQPAEPDVAARPIRTPGLLSALTEALFGKGDTAAPRPRPEPARPAARKATRRADESVIAPDLVAARPGLLEWLRTTTRELLARRSRPADRAESDAIVFGPGAGEIRPPKATAQTAPTSDTPTHLGLTAEERAAAEDEMRSFEEELPVARQKLEQADHLMHRVAELIRGGGLLQVEQVSPVAAAIVESITRNKNAMLWLSRLRAFDERAHARSVQCAVYMATFSRHLGLGQEQCEQLTFAGMVLDVGKLRVPPYVLEKPGPLVGEEVALARDHVMIGVSMLENSMGMHPAVMETVLRHHEREDGSGYPGRLRERDIGLYGRIAGIVDTFLALTNPRPYAAEVTMQEALRVLLAGRGTLFHAPLVEHFIQSISLFPVGSLVELSNGQIAAVVAHNRVRRLKPRVMILLERDGTRRARPTTLDLLYSPRDEHGEELRILRGVSAESVGVEANELFLSAGLA